MLCKLVPQIFRARRSFLQLLYLQPTKKRRKNIKILKLVKDGNSTEDDKIDSSFDSALLLVLVLEWQSLGIECGPARSSCLTRLLGLATIYSTYNDYFDLRASQ